MYMLLFLFISVTVLIEQILRAIVKLFSISFIIATTSEILDFVARTVQERRADVFLAAGVCSFCCKCG